MLRRNPRAQFTVDVEWAIDQIGVGAGLDNIRSWRQDFMVKRQCRFYQPGDTRRTLGMANHRLHTADRNTLGRGTGLLQELPQCQRFGAISHRCTGTVCFKQTDTGRAITGLLVGPLECAQLPFDTGCGQAHALAIGAAGSGLDNTIYLVTIALCIGQTLEHYRCMSLADNDPVGIAVKGAGPPPR